MLTQTFASPSGWFELEYPRTWEVEVVENLPCFYDPYFGSGGVLQVYALKIGTGSDSETARKLQNESPFLNGETLEDKMLLFLEAQGAGCDPDELSKVSDTNRHTDMIAREYHHEGRFYLSVMLQRQTTFVIALFNAPSDPEEEEAQLISGIIRSIRLFA